MAIVDMTTMERSNLTTKEGYEYWSIRQFVLLNMFIHRWMITGRREKERELKDLITIGSQYLEHNGEGLAVPEIIHLATQVELEAAWKTYDGKLWTRIARMLGW